MTGLSAISQTIAITKDLRNIDDKIVVAEFKLRISDIVDKLLDAKQSLVDAHEREADLRKEIATLHEKLRLRATLHDQKGLLYEVGSSGENIGEPYCNLCYVREEKLYRMRHVAARQSSFEHYTCDNCKTNIVTGPSLPRPNRNIRGAW